MLANWITAFADSCTSLDRSKRGPAFPEQVAAIIVVGSSCVGKTTLIDAIREANMPGCCVPRRYVTRGQRSNESCKENVHLDETAFEHKLRSGDMAWAWERVMHDQQPLRYGFTAAPEGSLAIYSGNNALYTNRPSISPPGAVRNALWLGVSAPLSVREKRMRMRSPDLSPAEQAFRLADQAEDLDSHVHLIASTDGARAACVRAEVCALIRELLSRMAWARVPVTGG